MSEQTTLIRSAGGFDIVPQEGGFRLVDTDTFNSWGTRPQLFATAELAADHAYDCEAFKRGRTMSVRPPVTGFEITDSEIPF
jgi:hypothetical protein